MNKDNDNNGVPAGSSRLNPRGKFQDNEPTEWQPVNEQETLDRINRLIETTRKELER